VALVLLADASILGAAIGLGVGIVMASQFVQVFGRCSRSRRHGGPSSQS